MNMKTTENTPTFDFKNRRGDGAKWGVTDFYEEFEEELVCALFSGLNFDTGYYGVKKEIESGRVFRRGDTIHVEVSCSDDFDTEGHGAASFPASDLTAPGIGELGMNDKERALARVRAALDEALDDAYANKRDNKVVALYTIGKDKGPKQSGWAFTFLRNVSNYDLSDSPPGDYYHRWGWQEVGTDDDSDQTACPSEIGAEVAAKIETAISEGEVDDAGKDGLVVEGWRVRYAKD